jgi:hypothetical protein
MNIEAWSIGGQASSTPLEEVDAPMTSSFIAYAGRPWPVEQDSNVLRQVGRFCTLDEAQRAFRSVAFRSLPSLNGRMRWRGSSPQYGLIVQIERSIAA